MLQELPSEKDSPESLRSKLGENVQHSVPIPTTGNKFGKKDGENQSNPFGFAETDETYWALQDSAERLRSALENLGPEGGYLSTEKARDVLVRTGLEKDQLRQIWNLSDVRRLWLW